MLPNQSIRIAGAHLIGGNMIHWRQHDAAAAIAGLCTTATAPGRHLPTAMDGPATVARLEVARGGLIGVHWTDAKHLMGELAVGLADHCPFIAYELH